MLGVPPGYIDGEVERQSEEIERRSSVYRGGRSPIPLEGRHAVLVDDGVATGGTAVASIRWARAAGAARVTFAAPVAAPPAIARLEAEADDVVVLAAPHAFGSVGQWYERFDQTRDAEVVSLLAGEPQHT
jgi:predicted phosphoribosyltransferase